MGKVEKKTAKQKAILAILRVLRAFLAISIFKQLRQPVPIQA